MVNWNDINRRQIWQDRIWDVIAIRRPILAVALLGALTGGLAVLTVDAVSRAIQHPDCPTRAC